jgi:hypothetical protein
MTRLEVLQSTAFLKLISLPNTQILNRILLANTIGEILFEGWEVASGNILNAAHNSLPTSGDILIPCVANNAPDAGNCAQDIYYLTPSGG